MARLKELVDPAGLLNPGVILNPDPQAHLHHLKAMPAVEEEVDKCIECGYCEPKCPSRELTLSPRQRIVVRREVTRLGLTGEDPYSVATVPWTEFFSPEKGLALHTAYWHDRFGTPRSHGCVNLAPRDARWLYFWSDPQISAGWMMSAGVLEAPGSIVRVRSAADPDPPLRGYAKRVFDERQASGSYH